MIDTQLVGRTALITGAARRLGKAIALRFAESGAKIIVHYHTSTRDAEATVGELRALGVEADAVCADLSDCDQTEQLCRDLGERFGPIHILVNNASIFEPISLSGTTAAELRRNDAIHVHSPLILSRWLHDQLPADESGSIVNLLDHRAFRVDPAYVPYSLSKSGLAALTSFLARALAPRVRVNSISPGAILAPPETAEADRANHLQKASADALLMRTGLVEDVVSAALFLVTAANYTTGIDLPVDGGKHLGC